MSEIEGQMDILSFLRGETDTVEIKESEILNDGMQVGSGEGKVIMNIPADGSYVEIFGHKLNGDFGNFQGFCDHLIELERTQSNWESLKKYLEDEIDEYERDKWCSYTDIIRGGAMKKLLEKMEELENG